MKKEDILKETQELVNEYLGTNTLTINGRNWSKERLLNRLNAYREMVELKRKADELLNKYSSEQVLSLVVAGKADETIEEAYKLKQKANEIWLRSF